MLVYLKKQAKIKIKVQVKALLFNKVLTAILAE